VAYVPYRSYPNSLSGLPLDFYECTLTNPIHDSTVDFKHLFIKFSCPTTLLLLEDFAQLKPANITRKLAAIFADRLGTAKASGATIHVKHSSETVDRVVF
jgi:hypothetical protein